MSYRWGAPGRMPGVIPADEEANLKVYSNTLTTKDLWAAVPDGVQAYIIPKGSRKREAAWDVTLYVNEKDALHRRSGNSGGYGASSDVAATWDEWGIFIDNLYVRDPSALIGWYKNPSHFFAETMRQRNHVRAWNKPESVAVRTHTAPWLERT